MAWFQLAGVADRDFEDGGLDRLWRRWSPSWDYSSEQRELALEALGSRARVSAALRYYRGAMRAAFLEAGEFRLILQPVSVPTLLIYGSNDGCLGAELMERSRTDFGGEYELLPVVGAGHFMHREQPSLVAARALEFLDRK
ncbi:MAG: pimeloyl-ACP methyl ester carboxylesterase [Bradymonadia bacterium]|jgi:pimeloyl-ACP methyl ester carboxylesterase